jgi:hypothetical protein
MKMKLRVRGL